MRIERVEMPVRYDGRYPPCRFRFCCDRGHLHPSFEGARRCNAKRPKGKRP